MITLQLPDARGKRLIDYGAEALPPGRDLWAVRLSHDDGGTRKGYRVSVRGGEWRCSCPGFFYRKRCKHVGAARQLRRLGMGTKTDEAAAGPLDWIEGGCLVRHSASLARLGPALVKARAAMRPPAPDKQNPHLKNWYADLAAVIEAVTGPLLENGLALVQLPCEVGGDPGLCSMLLHSSGEFIETALRLRPTKNDPQGVGSALTYARRYAAQAICGITADDDDGHQASRPAARQERPATTAPSSSRDAVLAALEARIAAATSDADLDALKPAIKAARPTIGPDGLARLTELGKARRVAVGKGQPKQ